MKSFKLNEPLPVIDPSQNPAQNGPDTGPHGTRVFDYQEIQKHLGDQREIPRTATGPASKAALLGLNGDFNQRRFDIPAGQSTIGRSSTNDIILDSDSVSHVHARMLQRDNDWWVLNLLSTNGTFVNGRKVTDSRIHDGDRIDFGDAHFMFHNPESKRAAGLGWLYRLGGMLRALLRK